MKLKYLLAAVSLAAVSMTGGCKKVGGDVAATTTTTTANDGSHVFRTKASGIIVCLYHNADCAMPRKCLGRNVYEYPASPVYSRLPPILVRALLCSDCDNGNRRRDRVAGV